MLDDCPQNDKNATLLFHCSKHILHCTQWVEWSSIFPYLIINKTGFKIKMPYSFKWVLISFLAAFTFDTNAQNNNTQMLSAIEQKILKDIEINLPATIQLLKESMNINSDTYNILDI